MAEVVGYLASVWGDWCGLAVGGQVVGYLVSLWGDWCGLAMGGQVVGYLASLWGDWCGQRREKVSSSLPNIQEYRVYSTVVCKMFSVSFKFLIYTVLQLVHCFLALRRFINGSTDFSNLEKVVAIIEILMNIYSGVLKDEF